MEMFEQASIGYTVIFQLRSIQSVDYRPAQ